MSNGNTVPVTGPDGKEYDFPAGTTKEKAIAYFKQKGIGVSAAAPKAKPAAQPDYLPTLMPTPQAPQMAREAGRRVTQKGQSIYERLTQPFDPGTEKFAAEHPIAGVPIRYLSSAGAGLMGVPGYIKDVLKPGLTPEEEKTFKGRTRIPGELTVERIFGAGGAPEALKYWTGKGEAKPSVGAVASVLPELTGQATGMAAGMSLLPDVGPEGLRERAAKLNTKVFLTAKEGARLSTLEKTADGLAVANEGIFGSMKNSAREIEVARNRTHGQYLKSVQDAQQRGVSFDLTKEVASIIDAEKTLASRKGTYSATEMKAIQQFETQLKNQRMPNGTIVPRDLSKITPQDVVNLISDEKGARGLLSEQAELEKLGSTARLDIINRISRQVRQSFLDQLDASVPEAKRLREHEHSLIRARESIDKQYTAMLNGRQQTARAVLQQGAAPMATYFGLRALGGGGMAGPWLGTIAMYKALASYASRTTRAALYAKAANLMDSVFQAQRGPTGAPGAPGGPTAPVAGMPPQVPPQQGLTPPAGAPPSPPQLPAAPPPAAAPPTAAVAPPSAPAPGAGEFIRSAEERVAATREAERTRMESREAAKAELEKKGGSVAQRNITPEVQAKNKALMDRIDEILNTKPKSAAHRTALERELNDIKKLLSGEASTKVAEGAARSEASLLKKRIADRERLAAKRTEAAATAGPAAGGAAPTGEGRVEAVSGAASPEARQVLLSQGYAELAKFENGPAMVKALKKLAADMQKVGSKDYDEVTQLAEAITALRQIKSMPTE